MGLNFYVAEIPILSPIMATYGPGTFLKKGQNPENRIPENRWVLGMFYLTTKLHIGIY